MATVDGISDEDWGIVHELAVEVVNAADNDRPTRRRQLLAHLDQLEMKYGPLVSIVATRADYLDGDDPMREQLFFRAYALAESGRDSENLIHLSHSLCEMYLEMKRLADADDWLSRLRHHLADSRNGHYWAEYERLRAEYRKLVAISPAQNTKNQVPPANQ